MTVRDFTQVFDSYAQFEELMLNKKIRQVDSTSEEEELELELR